MMNRQRYTLLLLLMASVLLSLLYIPPYNPLSGDKEIYRYIGELMGRGGVPYRDVFDHKPPVIFFLNDVGRLFGGWGQWFIDAGVALLATLLLFRLGKRYRLPYPWVVPLLFNLMLRDYLLCLGMGMTREYTAMLLVIFFCMVLGKHRYRYFGLGVLAGIVFFLQQDQVFFLLPFFVYVFLPENDKAPVTGRILAVVAGSSTIALLLIVYFAANHALADFWQDAFLFNLNWYTTTFKESFFAHLIKLKTLIDYGNYEVPVLVTLTIGGYALFLPSANRKLLLAALVAVPLSIISEFMGGRDIVPRIYSTSFSHYVLPLAASIPVLLFCVFAFTREPLLAGPKPQGIYAFLVCASLSYSAVQHGTHLVPLSQDYTVSCPELRYLRQQSPGDYKLYVFGNDDFVHFYTALKILAPSPWVYQHFWQLYDRWDLDHRRLHSIEQDLSRHHTTYILDFTAKPDWFRDTSAYSDWHGYLRSHYRPVLENAGNYDVLWKISDSVSAAR